MAAASDGGLQPASGQDSKCYIATCQRPTVVTHAVTCNFTAPKDLNLILAKCTRLELHAVGPAGLTTILDSNVYGRIAVLEKLRLPGYTTDAIFISTECYQYFVLTYADGRLVTFAKGHVPRVGRPAENGQLGFLDPDGRMIGLHLFEGSIKLIPIGGGATFGEAFDVKINELMIIAIAFLEGCDKPTIAVLYQEGDYRHVSTYVVHSKEKELINGPWREMAVEMASNLLIPVPAPLGGAIIVGESSIAYKSMTKSLRIPVPRSTAACACCVDGSRILLGTLRAGYGELLMVLLETGEGGAIHLKNEVLGTTSIPSAITYLDDGVVYVGSTYGDSQLVKLSDSITSGGSYVEVLETYSSIGPVMDMCVVDVDKQGQSQLVTCSGAYANGSLRIVTNGIGINELAELDMPGVQGIWSLHSEGAQQTVILALSLVGQTAFLDVQGDELEAIDIVGASTEETLHCADVCNGCWIQVVNTGVYLINRTTRERVAEWKPSTGKTISACSCAERQLLLAMGDELCYLSIEPSGLSVKSSTTLQHEIACIRLSPPSGEENESRWCIAGLWTDMSVRILELSGLREVCKEELGGEIIPRSVLIANFDEATYAFCALGDGSLFAYVMITENGELTHYKKLRLGSQPITLHQMSYDGKVHVFACSDRPTVIYLSNGKLVFSNVNLPEVRQVCQISTPQFQECLALVGVQGLLIGSIDDIRELQTRTVALGDAPYRLEHQQSSSSVLVITHSDFKHDSDGSAVIGWVKLLNHVTFNDMDVKGLNPQELPMSVVSMTLPDGSDVYCVGTCIMVETEDEPKQGRILTYKVIDGKLHQTSAIEVSGSVYTLVAYENGKLLAGINSKIGMYQWQSEKFELECGHHGHVLVLNMRSRAEFILVGDLMRSCTLLRYSNSNLTEVAMDYNNAFWVTAMEMFDEDNFMFSENTNNLLTCKRNVDAPTVDEQQSLAVTGEVHLGSMVNAIRPGTLAMRTEAVASDSFLFGTQSGSIGVVIPISADLFELLTRVCQRLVDVISSVGDLDHTAWRAFKSDRRRMETMRNFVDGDLVESFLDLKPDLMAKVVNNITVKNEAGDLVALTSRELISKIEALGRLH